jgi:alkylation response protein AidB-like acyl-CoA dehydrogenase
MTDFFQEPPHLGNQFEEDYTLKACLELIMGNALKGHSEDLNSFGERVVGELMDHHFNCERFPPTFDQYSAWGERIDRIYTHPSWSHMHRVSAEEHLISLGYSNFAFNRTVQFAKLYLFNPSGGLYTCPLAMTDGAAYLIKHILAPDPELSEVFSHLTSSNPSNFWTSGQWMTEKHGGSDVFNATKTTATHISSDKYKLNGFKWFTSATTAEVTFTLARVEGKISLFLVKTSENKKNLQIVRLKDKLGTRQLPTAEIILKDCIGKLVSPVGQGIKMISNMMNITRLYNSICAVSNMRRALAIARDFSHRRQVFGELLSSNQLHKETLFLMEVKLRGCLLWVLFLSRLLEKTEKNLAEEWEKYLLRLLTPVVKLYTGKVCPEVVKEGMEALGGVAFMENSGIPALLRDSEVLSIWEGTTNVLTFDVVRVVRHDKGLALFKEAAFKVCSSREFESRIDVVAQVFESKRYLRKAAFELGHIFVAVLFRMAGKSDGTGVQSQLCEYWKGNFQEKFYGLKDDLVDLMANSLVDGKPTGCGNFDKNNKPRYRL